MKHPSEIAASPLRRQTADVLRRARQLPVGPNRNDLRQLAIGLRWLERQTPNAAARDRATALRENIRKARPPKADAMEKFIRRENLAIYKKRLAEPHTDAERNVLLRLLMEEEARDLPPKQGE